MTSRSTSRSRKPIAGTCRTLKFTFSTPVISHWTRLQMRSPHWSEALSLFRQDISPTSTSSPSSIKKEAAAMDAPYYTRILHRKLGCQLTRRWLDQYGAVGENDGRHAAHAAIDLRSEEH